MNTTIAIQLKATYGRTMAYPANEQAERLARMLGAKTLTPAALKAAIEMGFTLSYVDAFGETRIGDAKAILAALSN